MGDEKIIEKELVYKINSCVFEVYRELGHGFLERVYEKALLIEFNSQRLKAQAQVPIQVHYKGEIVGDYYADLVIEDKVIIELKAQEHLNKAHEAQLLNYLKATKIEVGLLVNFAYPKATVKRFVF
jgi:GxxExxY protein